MDRPSRDDTCMTIAQAVGLRGTCLRRSIGAILVRDGRVISSGYNGAPSGHPHCDMMTCGGGELDGCLRTVHAELNAILFAARAGVSTERAVLYTTCCPCGDCAKAIINAGISEVIYSEPYRNNQAFALLERSLIRVRQWTKPLENSGS
jgi:dCMP deaminase